MALTSFLASLLWCLFGLVCGSPGLSWVLLCSPGLSWVLLGSPGLPGLSCALLSSPGLSWAPWALLGSSGLSCALLCSPGLSWALPGPLGRSWELLGSPGLSSLLGSPRLLSVVRHSRMWCPHDIGRDSWVWGEQKTLWTINSPHEVGEEALSGRRALSGGNGVARG